MYAQFVRNHFTIDLKDLKTSMIEKIDNKVINDYIYIRFEHEINKSISDDHKLIFDKTDNPSIEFQKKISVNEIESYLDSLVELGIKKLRLIIFDYKVTLHSSDPIIVDKENDFIDSRKKEYYSRNLEERIYINGDLISNDVLISIPDYE